MLPTAGELPTEDTLDTEFHREGGAGVVDRLAEPRHGAADRVDIAVLGGGFDLPAEAGEFNGPDTAARTA